MAKSDDYKLSLPTAILINVNIMLGAGVFINTPSLAQGAGALGPLMYLLVGLLMLPLILSIAQLLKVHPAGGFYTFAQKEAGPFWGFLSGWSYFTSKLASCMLMIHVSATLIQSLFPALDGFPPFLLDFLFVSLFCALNMLNIKASSGIQKVFMVFKTFPIFFVILAGLFFVQPHHFTEASLNWSAVYPSLPIVIYAVIGFEAACSMSSKIRNAEKNAPLAILISFGIVILMATLYQATFYGVLGEKLKLCATHCETFPAFIHHLFGDTPYAGYLKVFFHLAIASSTLGAAYGIIFSNMWNLHILAQNGHLWFSRFFTQSNASMVPFVCVLAEGVLCLTYLLVSEGVALPLQQIGASGCVIAYAFSVASLLRAGRNQGKIALNPWIPRLGLVSCALLLSACIRSFFLNGMGSLIVFSLLLILGVSMFASREKIFQRRLDPSPE